MNTSIHPLIKNTPELAQNLQALCDDDAKFAAQVEEYELLMTRLAGVQAGTESLSAEGAKQLAQECGVMQSALMRKLTLPTDGCCGGCGG
ncbi:MAG: hypothetical protein WBO82_08930 [Neisseria sp.]